ncbi:hypothetical protein KJ966_01900 [bacterium]|nr:hypothetical protein [bacterium]
MLVKKTVVALVSIYALVVSAATPKTFAEKYPLGIEALSLVWTIQSEFHSLRDNHPLNPENRLLQFNTRKHSTAIDLEWNPNLTEYLALRSRGAMVMTIQEDVDCNFDFFYLEGYLQWQNENRTLGIDMGKVKVEWGSGYAWNPTDVIIPLKRDVSNDIEEDEGIEMIKSEFVLGSLTSTVIIARLDRDEVMIDNPYQLAFKGSFEVDPWEVSAVYHQASQQGWTSGLSFTGLLTDAIEFHGEWSQSSHRDRKIAQKQADGIQTESFNLPARYEYIDDPHEEKYEKILVGGQYTFAKEMNIIMELYSNTHGYNDKEWAVIKEGIREALREDSWDNPDAPYTTSLGNPYSGFLKNTLSQVADGELRQQYLFLRYTSGESDNLWEWEQVIKLNLNDGSQIHQLILHKTWSEIIQTNLEITLFRGDVYSEFALMPYTESYTLNLEVPF